jgi:prepilin-type N-terminal cleavage/methylation domain-containing protein
MTTKQKPNVARRGGWTLIELSVVLVILATIAAGAAVKLSTPYRAARFENAIDRLVSLDGRARDHARRFNRPADLLLDLDGQSLRVVERQTKNVTQQVRGLGGAVVERVATYGQLTDYGTMAIAVNGAGGSPTYAVRLRNAGSQRVWVVFAGLTGQAIRVEDNDDIETILEIMASEGNDAA